MPASAENLFGKVEALLVLGFTLILHRESYQGLPYLPINCAVPGVIILNTLMDSNAKKYCHGYMPFSYHVLEQVFKGDSAKKKHKRPA